MQTLQLVIAILGGIASVIAIVAVFLKPLEEIMAYAGAIGFGAAIALCFLPIHPSEPDIARELNCGSVLMPESVQESSGATNPTVVLINQPLLAASCQDERRKVRNIALPMGIFSLLVLMENTRKVRRARKPKTD
jgi:hypothetical protein